MQHFNKSPCLNSPLGAIAVRKGYRPAVNDAGSQTDPNNLLSRDYKITVADLIHKRERED